MADLVDPFSGFAAVEVEPEVIPHARVAVDVYEAARAGVEERVDGQQRPDRRHVRVDELDLVEHAIEHEVREMKRRAVRVGSRVFGFAFSL